MMMMLALRCRWLGEGMEGVALGDEYRKGVFFGVAACIYYRNSLKNNGVHEAEKSRKPQIAIIE